MFYGESIKESKVIHYIECSLYEGIHYNESLFYELVVILNSSSDLKHSENDCSSHVMDQSFHASPESQDISLIIA
jgi:hypothetical protein